MKVGRKLTAVLDALPVGVLIADLDGRICQTNDQVSRICKATEAIAQDAYGELLGWWVSGGQGIKDPEGPLGRALRSGATTDNHRMQIRCFDGANKTIVAAASPLLGVGGKICGAVILIRDTSESEQIEAELEDRIARLVSIGVELEQTTHPRSD